MKRTEEDYKNDMNSLYNLDATPENIEKLLEPYIEEAVQDMIDASNELDAYEEELVNSPEFKENVEIAKKILSEWDFQKMEKKMVDIIGISSTEKISRHLYPESSFVYCYPKDIEEFDVGIIVDLGLNIEPDKIINRLKSLGETDEDIKRYRLRFYPTQNTIKNGFSAQIELNSFSFEKLKEESPVLTFSKDFKNNSLIPKKTDAIAIMTLEKL